MAKAKTTAAGTNLPVPQNDGEAEQLIARLGALQRDHATACARHDAIIAEHEEQHGKAVQTFKEASTAIIDGLAIWASAHRERLTNGGKSKTVQLPTGTILWREGRYAVKHRGMKNEDIVRAVRERLEAVEADIAAAKRGRRRADAEQLSAAATVLRGFLREKVDPNKEAMLADRVIAETIPGITVPRGPEEFAVEPLASQISEAA